MASTLPFNTIALAGRVHFRAILAEHASGYARFGIAGASSATLDPYLVLLYSLRTQV